MVADNDNACSPRTIELRLVDTSSSCPRCQSLSVRRGTNTSADRQLYPVHANCQLSKEPSCFQKSAAEKHILIANWFLQTNHFLVKTVALHAFLAIIGYNVNHDISYCWPSNGRWLPLIIQQSTKSRLTTYSKDWLLNHLTKGPASLAAAWSSFKNHWWFTMRWPVVITRHTVMIWWPMVSLDLTGFL